MPNRSHYRFLFKLCSNCEKSVVIPVKNHYNEKRIYKNGVLQLKQNKPRKIQNTGKELWQDYAFIILLLAALLFAFWKCRYGFRGDDESFYLSIPHRLSLGDALIRDEWHLSQLSGFLLYPYVSLYTLIAQGTEGLLLATRFLYVLLHGATAVFIYVRVRKFGLVSIPASILFFLFTPYDIMTLGYNTMGLDLVAVTGVFLATTSFKRKAPLIISGVTFAGAVLCNPYLAIAFILFCICVLIHVLLKRTRFSKNIFAHKMFSPKTLLWFTIGAASLALLFFIFLLSRTSIQDIITNIPYMLSDPEHPQIPMTTKLQSYFNSIWNCAPNFNLAIIAYGILLLALLIDRYLIAKNFDRFKPRRGIYLTLTCIITALSYLCFIDGLTVYYYNSILFPLFFVGLTSYILCKNKNKKAFVCLFCLGILYSMAMCFSSNQYFYVISMAMSAANIASLLFLGNLIQEMKKDNTSVLCWNIFKYAGVGTAAAVIVFQCALQVTVKANHCFLDSAMSDLKYTLSAGPAKGIITSQSYASAYESLYADMQYYKTKEKGNILFASERTWGYLVTETMPYGAYSAWLSGEKDSTIVRLQQYYTVNPDKIPKYIYVPKEAKWDFSQIYAKAAQYGYTVTENNISYKLEKQ